MDHDPFAVIEHAEVCRLAIRKHHRPRRRRLAQHSADMIRLLRCFPAVLVCLLAGCVRSLLLMPGSRANASSSGAAVPSPAVHETGAGPNSAWQKLLDARAALSVSTQDVDAFVAMGQSILADRAL